MRHFRNLLFFLVGVFAVSIPIFAFAETIAATGPTTVPAVTKYGYQASPTSTPNIYLTKAAAAQAHYSIVTTLSSNPTYVKESGPYSDVACTSTNFTGSTFYIKWRNPANGATQCSVEYSFFTQALTCESGTLSGSNCTNVL